MKTIRAIFTFVVVGLLPGRVAATITNHVTILQPSGNMFFRLRE